MATENLVINSFWDVEDYKTEQLKTLGVQKLEEVLREAKSEQKELSNEYVKGSRQDPLCYPPSWYDSYVSPVDWIVHRIEWAIDEILNPEDYQDDE